MMKPIFILIAVICFATGCDNDADDQKLQSRVDSLERKLATTYKPGFGEFMSGIQVHHAKLWFAGINNNWELAGFEIHEIEEALEDLKLFQAERKETATLSMMTPALDSVTHSIGQKDLDQFKNSFTLLTTACNNCHKAVNFFFNEVTIPTHPPFTNQSFQKK